jgi:hypothetical protein
MFLTVAFRPYATRSMIHCCLHGLLQGGEMAQSSMVIKVMVSSTGLRWFTGLGKAGFLNPIVYRKMRPIIDVASDFRVFLEVVFDK